MQVTKKSDLTGTKDLSEEQTSEKSDQIGAKNFSEVGHTEGTTEVRSTSRISTSSVSLVFYTSAALLLFSHYVYLKTKLKQKELKKTQYFPFQKILNERHITCIYILQSMVTSYVKYLLNWR